MISPILWQRKAAHRKAKSLAPGHTAPTWGCKAGLSHRSSAVCHCLVAAQQGLASRAFSEGRHYSVTVSHPFLVEFEAWGLHICTQVQVRGSLRRPLLSCPWPGSFLHQKASVSNGPCSGKARQESSFHVVYWVVEYECGKGSLKTSPSDPVSY